MSITISRIDCLRMKEPVFIKQNQDRWQQLEFLVDASGSDSFEPQELKEEYILITEDLSYARSHFPRSAIVEYLNSLSLRTHRLLQPASNKFWQSLSHYWMTEIPAAVYRSKGALLLAFSIFMGSVLFGYLACEIDPEFADNAIGKSYLHMTEQNIRDGNPAGVYGQDGSSEMSTRISLNNLLVAIYAVAGAATMGLWTIYMLFSNGIMLGSFENFLWHNHAFVSFNMALLIHGVLELAAIVIAAAASFRMVQGLLFPGTYPRKRSFAFASRDGLKLIISAIPLFVVAGILEGFVTRLSDMSYLLNSCIIVGSICLLYWYYIIRSKAVGYVEQDLSGVSR